MTKQEIATKQAQLTEAYNAAKAKARAENTIEARDAAVAASRELSAFISAYNPPKVKGSARANQAGQRQLNERIAMYGNEWRKMGWKG